MTQSGHGHLYGSIGSQTCEKLAPETFKSAPSTDFVGNLHSIYPSV